MANEKLKQAFDNLPHGDRVCELYGECTCGRDENIKIIKDYLNATLDLLQIREEQIDEFLKDKQGLDTDKLAKLIADRFREGNEVDA